MPRGESWVTTAYRALSTLGGEAGDAEILRWTQDNRLRLRFGWQVELISALRDNADGRGRSLFQQLEGPQRRWRLVGEMQLRSSPVATPGTSVAPRLASLIGKTLGEEAGGASRPLDIYLLAIAAYELDLCSEALRLLDRALEFELADPFRSRADQLRLICLLRLEQ